jgi:hypothetical protein
LLKPGSEVSLRMLGPIYDQIVQAGQIQNSLELFKFLHGTYPAKNPRPCGKEFESCGKRKGRQVWGNLPPSDARMGGRETSHLTEVRPPF